MMEMSTRLMGQDLPLVEAALDRRPSFGHELSHRIDNMTGKEIREARARLAAEKVRAEALVAAMTATLSAITDALRARD